MIHITDHAYGQYLARGGGQDRNTLTKQVNAQHEAGEIDYDWHDFILLGGTWWVYQTAGDDLHFVTCYGNTKMDIPRALAWAAHHGDRINLEQTI